ncbi:tyrosine--tRNA ligase [Patescibacteria group bacterium]
MTVDTSKTTIEKLIDRGTGQVTVEKDLRKKLASGKVLRIKHGIDPTTPDLHLGYAVVYEKLRQFQEAGHKIVFLIGDYTGRFGDPTDKDEAREMRSAAEVKKLAKKYIDQVGIILDLKKTEIRYNSEWYDKMSAEELLHIMSEFTAARVLERDMFQERMKEKQDIRLHELVYPVLQGYDSVMLKSDATVIGSDQIFNELQARGLQEVRKQVPQDLVAVPLLIGTDGKMKMSQSLGNYIGLADKPKDMYGKIMSIPDNLIADYFEYLARISDAELLEIKKQLKDSKTNPRDLKARLAHQIVSQYHSEAKADKAAKEFTNVFQKHEVPTDVKEYKIAAGTVNIFDLLTETGLTQSKSEARRLIQQNAVSFEGKKIIEEQIEMTESGVLQVGKRRFLKIVIG